MRRFLTACLLFGAAACDRDHDHPHPPPGGEEEEKTAQVTVWGERFEIFLEHKFIVAGVPTALVTHVSDLKTLEPRRKDKVVFVLRQGEAAPIEHSEAEPLRPGIYIPQLTFPAAGLWSVTLRLADDGQESVVELPPFTVYATKEDAKKAPAPAVPEGVTLFKEQQWRILLKAEPVGKRKLVERVRVPAVVAARPGFRAAVVPPLPGRLIAPAGKGLPALGDRVVAGQVLALVQPPFLELSAKLVEARADVLRAKLALDQADLVLARVRKLAEGGARTERELQDAEFASRGAKASHDAALALKEAYERSGAVLLESGSPALELRAPIAGVVTAVQAVLGEHAGTETPVLQILDASKVHVEARIPEAELSRIGKASAALLERPGARGSFVPLEGRFVFLSPEVDAATRSVTLVFEAENPEGLLRIGSALTLHLETSRSEEALAVPASAVVEEDARPIAFVQVSGEIFEKRYLKLGMKEGPWIQVLEGLAEGDRVVTREAMAVRLASLSSVIPAHSH